MIDLSDVVLFVFVRGVFAFETGSTCARRNVEKIDSNLMEKTRRFTTTREFFELKNILKINGLCGTGRRDRSGL